MENAPLLSKPVTPNRAIPKVLGILSIVFSSLMLMGGLCQVGLSAASPFISNVIKDAQKKLEADEQKQKEAALKKLEDDEKAATNEEDKAQIQEQRKMAAARPKVTPIPMIDFMKFAQNKTLVGWTWTESLTGIVGNVALLIVGIGLVTFKPWARKAGLWLAGWKILRLIVLYAYAAFVIVPPFAKILGPEVSAMLTAQTQAAGRPVPAQFTPEALTKVYVVTYTVMCVVMIVLGSVYPLIMLFLLSRPSATAACSVPLTKEKQNDAW